VDSYNSSAKIQWKGFFLYGWNLTVWKKMPEKRAAALYSCRGKLENVGTEAREGMRGGGGWVGGGTSRKPLPVKGWKR